MTKKEMQEKVLNIPVIKKTLQNKAKGGKMNKDEQERFDELAGKYEYSAGMSREEAERKARGNMDKSFTWYLIPMEEMEKRKHYLKNVKNVSTGITSTAALITAIVNCIRSRRQKKKLILKWIRN